MKKYCKLIYFLFASLTAFSQTITCSNFTIIGSYPDTINPNEYQISINFDAGPNDIVNYPNVSAVLDCNGDTVAIGGLFYFGQLGQTTQDYPVTILDSTVWCQPITAIFIYGSGTMNEADTCILSYQSSILENISSVQQVTISPNPALDFLQVTVSNNLIGKGYQIMNQLGQVLIEGQINSKNDIIKINTLSSGYYSLKIIENRQKVISVIKE